MDFDTEILEAWSLLKGKRWPRKASDDSVLYEKLQQVFHELCTRLNSADSYKRKDEHLVRGVDPGSTLVGEGSYFILCNLQNEARPTLVRIINEIKDAKAASALPGEGAFRFISS